MAKSLEMRVEEVARGQRVELLLNGKHVSGLIINDLQMRIGRAVVHMGGIGGVHTAREHRMKGYSRQVSEYANEYMLKRGYDVSLLFGIQHFYHKFGFACCLPDYRLTLPTRIAERVKAERSVERGPADFAIVARRSLGEGGATTAESVKVRRARKKEFSRIRTIYNQQYADRTGTVVRPRRWAGFRMGSSWGSKTVALVAATRGRILSYVGFDNREDAMNVFELAGDPRTYPALLAALVREAVRRRVENIAFLLPPDDGFTVYARRFGGRLATTCHYTGGGMARIINLVTLFEKLAPELSARLAGSALAGKRAPFVLKTDVGAVTLTARDGQVSVSPAVRGRRPVVSIPQHRLSQLLFGFRTVADVAAEPGVRVPAGLRELLDVLFPFHWAHVSRPDYF